MQRCKICDEWKYEHRTHKCLPKFQTQIPDYDNENDWLDTYARDPESAATKRAEDYDVDDHNLLDGDDVDILVKNTDGKIEKFSCTGEVVPEYRATKIT